MHGCLCQMAGHDIELLGSLPALDRDRLPLLGKRRRARHQWPQFLFQAIHRLDRAICKYRDRDHRSGDHDKRDRYDRRDDYQPEQWIVSAHLAKPGALSLVLSAYNKLLSSKCQALTSNRYIAFSGV